MNALLKIVACLLFFSAAANAANMFPEDTGFETGVQNFRYNHSEEPIQTVSGDAAEGTASLRIDHGVAWAGGRWGDFLRPGVVYTVSFYAKRVSGGDSIDFAFIGVDWRQYGRTSFQLTSEWKRYSCRVRTQRAEVTQFPVSPAFLPTPGGAAAVFQVDAIQLEEGNEASSYQPSEPFSLYPTVAPGEVAYTPEIPRLAVNMFNAAFDTEAFTLRVQLAGKVHERAVRMKQGTTARETIPLPEATHPGYYPARVDVLDASGKLIKSSVAPFVVTDPFPAPDAGKPGFSGMQESSLPNEFIARIGGTWMRSGLGQWRQYEPQEGIWAELPLPRPKSLAWHPSFKMILPKATPPWRVRAGAEVVDPDAAKDYFDHVFGQLAGKVTYVDFINEPDLIY